MNNCMNCDLMIDVLCDTHFDEVNAQQIEHISPSLIKTIKVKKVITEIDGQPFESEYEIVQWRPHIK